MLLKPCLIREINVECFFFPDDDDSQSQDKIQGERIKHTAAFNPYHINLHKHKQTIRLNTPKTTWSVALFTVVLTAR